jgi:hypothetical protein
MLYRIIYNSKDVIGVIKGTYDLEIGFRVLEIIYSASEGVFKISQTASNYFNSLIDNYIDFIEKHPDVNEIIIHNSVLSILLRSIKYSINHISDKDSFINNLKKNFIVYYKLTALLAMNVIEENLIISSLYALFIYSKEIILPLPAFRLPEHKIVYRGKELSYYVFPYLLEVKLDKALIAYKENVVLDKERIRGYSDYETVDLGVMKYRARSV